MPQGFPSALSASRLLLRVLVPLNLLFAVLLLGFLVLTFVATVLDHTQDPPASRTKTVLRVVLPQAGALGLADFIHSLLGKIGEDATGGGWTVSSN